EAAADYEAELAVRPLGHGLVGHEVEHLVLEREEVHGDGLAAEDDAAALGIGVAVLALEVDPVDRNDGALEVAGGIGEENAEAGIAAGVCAIAAGDGEGDEAEEKGGPMESQDR